MDDDDVPLATGTDSETVKQMLRDWQLSADAENDNRTAGLADVKFSLGGDYQHDDSYISSRRGSVGGDRPTDAYNQCPQFINQVINDQRMNMPQIKFIPGNDTSKELAEVREDLVRNIQSSSEAEVAVDTAVDGQVRNGWGYFRILTDYENQKTFDQIIKFGRISNPFTIYDDPYAVMQDRSDRNFLIQVCDVNKETFNSDYDKDYDTTEIESIGDRAPDWATSKTVRIAEYWRVKYRKSKLYRTSSGAVTKEKPSGKIKPEDAREVNEPYVMWYKCTALDVLDSKEWPGIYIPYVFLSGTEVDVDGKKVLSGIIRNLRPAQKQLNYWTNAATEMVALAPKAPFILDPRQIEGYEKYWDNANTKNYPYLPAKMMIDNQPMNAPQRQQAEPPITAMMAMIQQAQQNMYSTTGIYPSSLGRQGAETSGVAISRREHQSDVSNFHYTDNTARAIRFAGRIIDDLIPKIYDAERTVGLLKEDKTARTVKINGAFTDPLTKKTVNYDMKQGVYDIAVTTGPNITTKRQEAVESMTAIIQAAPELMGVAGDLLVGNMDWPGADKLAERLKKTLPPGLADDHEGQPQIPVQVQQQMQQMQQVIEQGGQELQQLQQQLADKSADIQLKGQQMQIDAQEARQDMQIKQAELKLELVKIQQAGQKLQADYQMKMAETSQQPQAQDAMATIAQTMSEALQQVAQITAESSQAVVESNQMVAQAIMAPKTIVRDSNGMTTGVVTNGQA